MRTFAVLLALVLYPVSVAAQTPTIPVGSTFNLSAAHDGQFTNGYRVYLDGQQIAQQPVSALANGEIRFLRLAGPTTRGGHTLELEAYNVDAASPRAALAFTATLPPPSAPTNLRFVVDVQIAEDGTVRLNIKAQP